MNLANLLEQRHTSGSISWEREGTLHSITNKEFWNLVKKVRSALYYQGVRENDYVLIQLPNSPEWIILDLAIMGLGAITTTLPTEMQKEKEQILINRLNPKKKFTMENFKLKATLEDSFTTLLNHKDPMPPHSLPAPSLKESHIATIIFTSGSSGIPKAVPLSHENILFNLQNQPIKLNQGTHLSYLPLSHIFERTCGTYNALYLNFNIFFLDDPKKISTWVRKIQPTLLLAVPAVLRKMMKKSLEKKSSKTLYHLAPSLLGEILQKKLGGKIQYLVCGSAPLSNELKTFIKKTRLPVCTGYGMSEAGPLITGNYPDKNQLDSVGTPLKGVQVRIVDNQIQIKSPGLFSDYLPPDNLNRKPSDWFNTGDCGYLKDGFLYITGRQDELLVLSNGKKLYPTEIETILEELGLTNVIITTKKGHLFALIDANQTQEEIQKILDTYNKTTESYKQVRNWKKIPELSIKQGHLTSTLKKKRKQILKDYDEDN